MTISSATSRVSYTGTSAVSVYAYTFKIIAQADIQVTVRHPTSYAETLLTLTTDYTVSGAGESSGGNVTLVNSSQAWLTSGSLTTDWIITIRRIRAVTQSTDIRNQGDFLPETHENAFDHIIAVCQKMQDEIDRCIKIKVTEAGTAAYTQIGPALERASKFIAFDASGNATLTSTVTLGVTASAFMQTVLDDASAAVARATLGATGSSGKWASAEIADNTIAATNLSSGATPTCFEARVTLATATPVTVSDQTAKTTVYLTPYKGNKIALYDGTNWELSTLTEISIAVPASTSQMYDLFVYDNAGTLTLDATAWTNDTTRATALATQNGILVKTGSLTRRYCGSFRTTGSSGQTEDSFAKRYVWNYYNRVERPMKVVEGTDSWTYSTSTYRQANGAAGNQLDFIIGVEEEQVEATVNSLSHNNNDGVERSAGIGLDSTTVNSATLQAGRTTLQEANDIIQIVVFYRGYVGVGRHVLVWLEYSAATATTTWLGDNGNATFWQSGIVGSISG